MSSSLATTNLSNHFLIAMPGLQDAIFSRSVVFVCEHNEHGCLGLVINKPCTLDMRQLFDKFELPLGRDDLATAPVFCGGPVQAERGFVLHDAMLDAVAPAQQSNFASTMMIPGGLGMTVSRDVLEAISSGGGPRKVLLSLGCSAWDGGQLEAELSGNCWLTVAASATLIFDTPVEQRYQQALALLGLEAWMLAPDTGHA